MVTVMRPSRARARKCHDATPRARCPNCVAPGAGGAARRAPAFSPHYVYPTDDGWKMNGPLEADEFRTHTFARKGPLTLTGFANSGADWLDRFKRYIEDGKTIVVSPHKVFGPQTNDLVLQLRKRGMSKIILGGMLATMCVQP